MSDATAISSQLALAGALVSAAVTLGTLVIRSRNKERLKALDAGTASSEAAAVIADAVPSFKLNTDKLNPDHVANLVRQEIEARDRRHARYMRLSLVAIVAFGGLLTILALISKSPPPYDGPATSATFDVDLVGQVVAATKGELAPVIGATVTIDGYPPSAITDDTGHFRSHISGIKKGAPLRVRVTHPQYDTVAVDVMATSETFTLNSIRMHRLQ